MTVNYKILVQYDGTRYEGWQRQKKSTQTIQGKLEQVLSRMTEKEIEIDGAGRTDAGVHAKNQTASVHLAKKWDPKEILQYMNQYLPEDICVKSVEPVSERFHARLWAEGKCYSYRKFRYHLGEALDVEAMRRAAQDLVGTHDFKTFCGNPKMKKSTVRTITDIVIEESEHEIRIVYAGNGFLQYMVRILTGTLIEVGQHRRDADSMPELLERMERKFAGVTAPAEGLCLERVFYSKK